MLTGKVGVAPSLGNVWIVLHWWETFQAKHTVGYSTYNVKEQNNYYKVLIVICEPSMYAEPYSTQYYHS